MTPAAFDVAYRPYASGLAARFGLDPDLFLAQWAVETAWGDQLFNCNLANIRDTANSFAHYPSLGAFCDAEAWLLANGSAVTGRVGGDYAAIRVSAKYAVDVQMQALGASPWDAGHYNNGGGPGSSLLTFWEELRMATLDTINTNTQYIYEGLFYPVGQTPHSGLLAAISAKVDAQTALIKTLSATAAGSLSPAQQAELDKAFADVEAAKQTEATILASIAALKTELDQVKAEVEGENAKLSKAGGELA